MLQCGVLPERLKCSIIIPIHKKGDKSLLANYRPISLLTSFSKIVERVMYNRLVSHLTKHTILSPNNQIRSVRPYMSSSSLVKIYHSLFYSLLSYGIIFWGQATNTKKLFLTQKRALSLITGYGNWFSCRNLFRHLGILLLKSQYIYSVLLFL
jgi:hypothetical protein